MTAPAPTLVSCRRASLVYQRFRRHSQVWAEGYSCSFGRWGSRVHMARQATTIFAMPMFYIRNSIICINWPTAADQKDACGTQETTNTIYPKTLSSYEMTPTSTRLAALDRCLEHQCLMLPLPGVPACPYTCTCRAPCPPLNCGLPMLLFSIY